MFILCSQFIEKGYSNKTARREQRRQQGETAGVVSLLKFETAMNQTVDETGKIVTTINHVINSSTCWRNGARINTTYTQLKFYNVRIVYRITKYLKLISQNLITPLQCADNFVLLVM